MKGRIIVLNAQPRHAALVVDGKVEDLLLDDDTALPMPGEIHRARIGRKIKGAAFVELSTGQMGYLRDIKDLQGQKSLPVQIASVAEPGKAIPVERRLLIKGRNLILTPGAPGVNISRQIRDPEERERLTSALSEPDDKTGIIVRSAAKDAPLDVLRTEYKELASRLAAALDPESRISEHHTPESFALREWTTPLPDMIAIPDALERDVTANAMLRSDPDLLECVEPGDGDPFDHFGVWDEIEKLKSPRVDLPAGGWMAIEATRAMVTVDVNTGDQFSDGAGMTANLEAIRELPRQLRLRGLGGQITIDFAPIRKAHRKKIEETLKSTFRRDPIATTIAGWTPLGNFELQRKRERRPLLECL